MSALFEKQTLTDIEIILVNDGSTDNSGRLLREYADKDARFVYVEQENQGLSAARNTGMEHASCLLYTSDAADEL